VTDPLRMLHASDLHIDNTPEGHKGFVQLVDAAVELDVDVVVLVGDTFDDSRANPETLTLFVEHLDRLRMPVVILPGNHDPHMAGSAYERMELPDHVVVLSEPDGASVELPTLGVELWGRPHISFADSRPLSGLPPRGDQPWQVALAHGHLVRYPEDRHRSYLITSEEIAASDRDYVALGHWDVQHDASAGDVTAWYSGSPRRYAACVLVTFSGERDVKVEPIQLPG
jgi:DNA repair exonuclease SbcCD nuclease subunit